MKPEVRKNRKNVGLELRRTHYTLGKDQWNYLSQYRKDYPPKSSEKLGPNMDSVTLRRTHFNLGDDKNPYQTTSMEQSKQIFDQSAKPAFLDENIKADLRRSHFIFGNNEPNYMTQTQREYYDKSKLNNKDNIDFKNVERGLRATNYVLGDEQPNYVSETAAKYTRPVINPNDRMNPENKISTAQLQQSHYVFGTNQVPWVTTQQLSFGPKKVEQKLYTKNLTKTNFVLGDDEPTLKSVNQETFVKHPISANPINKELANDLRRHHFNFGNEDYPNQLTTVNNQTYTDPHLKNEANSIKKLDPQALRASHWSFGDSNLEPAKEHFATTYGLAMKPKEMCKVEPIPASTFKSSFSITGTYPNTYSTESRSNFVPVSNKMDPEEFKQMQKVVKDIRSSHFELGEMPNDYGTTTGNSYRFDPQSAKNARGTLDRALINDLRATHYKLGYNPMCNTTTHRATYVPFKVDFKNAKDPNLRKSHFDFGNTNNAIQDGKTIYMTDYVPKPLPVEEDDSD